MVGIPPTEDTDVEDVVWALQTASSLWSKNERVDAIVWLRRAAQAAGEAEQDERALLLAREAAELSDWIAKNPVHISTSFAAVTPSEPASGGVDDLLRASIPDIPIEEGAQVSMSAMTEPHAFAPVKLPPLPAIPPAIPPATPPMTPVPAAPEVFQSVRTEPDSGKVRSAEEAHAGLLDPWSTTETEEPRIVTPLPAAAASAVVSSDEYEDEVVTSARIDTRNLPPAEPAVVMPAPPLPVSAPIATPPKIQFPVERTLVSAGVTQPKGNVDLSGALALADLPDDARAELERVATIHALSLDEEVMGFALAYVVEGDIDVAAQIVDAPAERISTGKVLKAKGTVAESMPLRLICASDKAIVATWDAEQIDPAFKACPWVEDDLRASANRMQALVGVTLGPLADRLDATLRAQVTSRLELRELAEGDVLVEAGEPVRDLCLVGQGCIELVTDGKVTGEVATGEFLFPTEIIGGGKATATARAGKGGALILASGRAVAQELMSTCPPLLEIFAGM
jgi:Cyclic nucleotide-binding domain